MQAPSPFQMQPETREWQVPGEAAHADEDAGGDSRPQPVLNVVVCGALMSAFEMSCQWDKVGKHVWCTSDACLCTCDTESFCSIWICNPAAWLTACKLKDLWQSEQVERMCIGLGLSARALACLLSTQLLI